jgi:hypothetical protein
MAGCPLQGPVLMHYHLLPSPASFLQVVLLNAPGKVCPSLGMEYGMVLAVLTNTKGNDAW